MIDEIELHPYSDEFDDSFFRPGSDTRGKYLEFDDEYLLDLRWRVPSYFQDLSMAVRGDIMYHVHAILGNIAVDTQEIQVIHGSAVSVLASESAIRYLREQLKLMNKRILH